MWKAYSLLITGQKDGVPPVRPLEQTYGILRAQIEVLLEEFGKLAGANDQSFRTLGPFLARSLLELSLGAILGRIDPFRLLALRQCQLQEDYNIGERILSSLQWTGDILPKENCSTPWSGDREFHKIPRSLFSEPYEQLFWTSALLQLNDAAKGGSGGDWLAALKAQDPHKFVARAKGELRKLYSSLSKGVHHELLIPIQTIYSREIVRNLFEDAVRWPSLLAAMLSFVEHCYNPLAAERALALLDEVQQDLFHA